MSVYKFTSCTDVTGGVWGPGNAVHTSAMVIQPGHRCTGHSYIQNHYL